MPRDQAGTRIKGRIQNKVRFGPILDMKVCNHNGRFSIEIVVQCSFQDQTVSWIRIASGIDKFVTEAMSDVNFNPIGQRKWIDIETQESNDLYCFQVSKVITRLLRQSKVHREEDQAVHCGQGIDECKKKQFDNAKCRSLERKKDFVNAPH